MAKAVPNKKDVSDALSAVAALEKCSGLQIADDGRVSVVIEVDPSLGPQIEDLRQRAEKSILAVNGVSGAHVIMTAERAAQETQDSAPSNAAPDPHNIGKIPRLTNIPARKIIAVASGKGGVGKSTVAAGLACELAQQNLKVGLLDADIYGPSQPRMMGLSGQKPQQKNEKITPLGAHGVTVMSIGFMIEDEAPLVWRGPMVQSALVQLFRDVDWAPADDPLDILLVDMPPGTGDAQLTLAQKVPVDGAIIVSTPQDIALLDARKGIGMFEKVDVPVLGIIENMSTHICSNCGHEEHIFGHGGAREEAEKLGVPFLGEIPLDIAVRTGGDAGKPTPLDAQIAQQIISACNL